MSVMHVNGRKAVPAIGAAIFGVFWISMAVKIGAPTFMILFGLVFVAMAIGRVIASGRDEVNNTRSFANREFRSPDAGVESVDEVFGEGKGEYRITTAPESVKERLEEVEELKRKGLVSPHEYQEQREKILADL